MLSILQSRYQRVEKALDTLLESITAYNPSIAAADELVAADDAVNDALEELAVHHARHARILSLRATSAALDAQISSTLRSLVDTRRTLKGIGIPPASSYETSNGRAAPAASLSAVAGPAGAEDTRRVTVDELLSYAKFISKTTVPPTRRGGDGDEEMKGAGGEDAALQQDGNAPLQQPPAIVVKAEPGTTPPVIQQQQHQQQVNGRRSSAVVDNMTVAAASSPPDALQQQQQQGQQDTTATMRRALPLEIKGQFVPWPSLELIKLGALGAVQSMVERGIDPASVVVGVGTAETVQPQAAAAAAATAAGNDQEQRGQQQGRPVQNTYTDAGPRAKDEDEFDPDEM